MDRGGGLRIWVAVFAATCAAVALGGTVLGSAVAGDADHERCSRFREQSEHRERIRTGHGERIAVLGDSWSAGLGLARPESSWPARLPGRTTVFGFSGSGFAAHASPCAGAAFGTRVARTARAADVVVVEGGLNDVDQPDAAIRAGVRRVLRVLHGHRVVVVGPAAAPARADRVPRVDALLAAECARAEVTYVSTSGLRLPYLPDGLHLTPAGHRAFGDFVAREMQKGPGPKPGAFQ
ncbi:SGNH/GDSL hydrolase family protein [Marmoricola sp. RAF53]|uniref:SGNH/GDSL hydrolase family protein n=1 Tax=Marmoricola sp. RAF53 TaxID=3233059 RepID=UPI003F980A8C